MLGQLLNCKHQLVLCLKFKQKKNFLKIFENMGRAKKATKKVSPKKKTQRKTGRLNWVNSIFTQYCQFCFEVPSVYFRTLVATATTATTCLSQKNCSKNYWTGWPVLGSWSLLNLHSTSLSHPHLPSPTSSGILRLI